MSNYIHGIPDIGYVIGTPIFGAQSISAVGAPVTVSPGGTFQASRSIQNTGLAAGTCSYTIRLSTDTTITTADPVVYTGTTPSIAPGGTNTATVTCTVPGAQAVGPYYLGLYIAGPPISTANTTNQDVIVGTFTPVAQSITVPGAQVSIPPAGGTFQATRAIQNTGTLAGTTNYDIYLSLDQTYDAADISVFNGTTASIAAGATDTQTDTCTVPAGLTIGTQYYVILYIAAGNEVSTTNQDVLIGGPIFTASSITTVGAPINIPQNGGTFQATRVIQNTGNMAGTCNYDIYISLDSTIDATDTQVFSGTTASIAAGATDTATDTCTVPSGLTVGNTYYVGLYIAGPPVSTAATAQVDITIVNFQPVAQTVNVIGAPVNILSIGGSFQATRSIQNTGGIAGTANYTLYLSSDQTYDAADISVFSGTTASIAAGATDTATDTCTVAGGTTAGSYYVLLYLGPSNEVSTTNQDVTVLTPFNAVAQGITVQGAPVSTTPAATPGPPATPSTRAWTRPTTQRTPRSSWVPRRRSPAGLRTSRPTPARFSPALRLQTTMSSSTSPPRPTRLPRRTRTWSSPISTARPLRLRPSTPPCASPPARPSRSPAPSRIPEPLRVS
jgi:hypothetical protein